MTASTINWDNLRIFLAVARLHSVQEAARYLDIDHSTVTRRMHRLEAEMATLLFNRTPTGHALTPVGQRLLEHAESIESTLAMVEAELGGDSQVLTGPIRLGVTEGFGSFFLAPHLMHFGNLHPATSVDILVVPRFVNLSTREADLAINIERPQGTSHVTCKLTDYRLRLYANSHYLKTHPPIRNIADLADHRLIGYVDELSFSTELLYLQEFAPKSFLPLRSTSIVAQYFAARQGRALAVLPCFMAADSPDLVPVLPDKIDIVRSLWLAAPSDRRQIARVRALWDYLRSVVESNQAFLMGKQDSIVWIDKKSPLVSEGCNQSSAK